MANPNGPGSCGARHPRPLWATDTTQGWGNRLGWWLTVAATAEMLRTEAFSTVHGGNPRSGGGRNYDFRLVLALVELPRALRLIETTVDGREGAFVPLNRSAQERMRARLGADEIPRLGRDKYVNDYVPEPAWTALRAWAAQGLMRWWPSTCASRDGFLAAYRAVQRQLRPTPLGAECFRNPPPRSYLALHLRRGDRARMQRRCGRTCALTGGTGAAAGAAAEAVEALLLSNRTLGALRRVGARDGRPWLVLSDNERTREAAEVLLRSAGLVTMRRPPLPPPPPSPSPSSPSSSPSPPPGPLSVAAMAAAHDCVSLSAADGGATFAMLRDWFALLEAAGVAVAPLGRRPAREQGVLVRQLPDDTNPPLEGSFSTVAALAGDAPLLNPFPFASGGPLAHYETAGNGGAPMRGIFFLEDIDTFAVALRDGSTRYRAPMRGAPASPRGPHAAPKTAGATPTVAAPVARAAKKGRCLLTAFDTDGAGRRLESSLMCAATAHALRSHFEYIHANVTTLEHGASPAAANSLLGLAAAYPTVALTAARAHTPRLPRAHTPHRLATSASSAVPWGTCPSAGAPTWFEAVRDGTARCDNSGSDADGASGGGGVPVVRPVHVLLHCYDFFWCRLVKEQPQRWYELLPRLQAAAAAVSAPPTPPLLALSANAINVGLHIRSVKRRRLKNGYWGSLVGALHDRHARFVANRTGSGAPPALHLWVHTDKDLPRTHNGSCAGGLLCGLAKLTGVRLITPAMLAREKGSDGAEGPMHVMRQLGAVDLIAPSESSLSIVPALMSNASVLVAGGTKPGESPCSHRTPLPHWRVLPCDGNPEQVATVIAQLPWPPPRAAARFGAVARRTR